MSAQTIVQYAIIGALLSSAACAGAGPTAGPVGPGASFSPLPHDGSRSGTAFTATEIARVNASTAYSALQRLNPALLRSGRGPSLNGRAVYVDGLRRGGLEQLHEIPARAVREIRFLNAVEATVRFGIDHPAGAVVIITKSGPS